MPQFRKTPFKADRIEDDPTACGLRTVAVTTSSEALFNGRSVLISGPRGIGKSSLGAQIQRILKGDHTLLRRCEIAGDFPKAICAFHACDVHTTLEQLVMDIVADVEQKAMLLPELDAPKVKASLELNLGVLKASLGGEASIVVKHSPSTIGAQFVRSLVATAVSLRRSCGYIGGINIMIDELDQLSPEINFGHFLKIIHEHLVNSGENEITFVLAGQLGIYRRLLEEDLSAERIVQHVPISVLGSAACEHILDYAARQAVPRFEYEPQARKLILSLSGGHPYALHLVGDAAFRHMRDPEDLTLRDALLGLREVLLSDKREKYLDRLRKLDRLERQVLLSLSGQNVQRRLPSEISLSVLDETLGEPFSNPGELDAAISSLSEKGHLILLHNRQKCRFAEELFRIFIALMLQRKKEHDARKEELAEEADRARDERAKKSEKEAWRMAFQQLREGLEGAKMTTSWDEDDVTEFYSASTDSDE